MRVTPLYRRARRRRPKSRRVALVGTTTRPCGATPAVRHGNKGSGPFARGKKRQTPRAKAHQPFQAQLRRARARNDAVVHEIPGRLDRRTVREASTSVSYLPEMCLPAQTAFTDSCRAALNSAHNERCRQKSTRKFSTLQRKSSERLGLVSRRTYKHRTGMVQG